jgi:hypothetical protein
LTGLPPPSARVHRSNARFCERGIFITPSHPRNKRFARVSYSPRRWAGDMRWPRLCGLKMRWEISVQPVR